MDEWVATRGEQPSRYRWVQGSGPLFLMRDVSRLRTPVQPPLNLLRLLVGPVVHLPRQVSFETPAEYATCASFVYLTFHLISIDLASSAILRHGI